MAPKLLAVAAGSAILSVVSLVACQPAPPPPPTTTTTTTTTAAPPGSSTPVGWRYLGGDEFSGTTLDTSRWHAYWNTYGDANAELACLTPANVVESGGSLKITARRQSVTCPGGTTEQYTSGFVGSREAGTYYPRYARFEVRAKVPHGQGLWPAFWLRHRNGAGTAEVDVMEYFHSQVPGRTSQTLHLDGRTNLTNRVTAFEAPTSTPGWHRWAVDILPDPNGVRFTFWTDGVAVHTFVDTQHHWSSADPQATWDVALNLAVGGRWVGRPDDALGYLRDVGRCSISGTPPDRCDATGIRPPDWGASTYEVDYVRVYVPA